MRRGEVWWAVLPPPAGRRPVVLLTRDSVIDKRASVTIAPITRTARGISAEVGLDESDGMPVACVVNADDIVTVQKATLQTRITSLSAEKMEALSGAVVYALDLEADLGLWPSAHLK
ncbi:MAG: type II toxin-antitoxin system PemK/MazF family toxin [SAR202 cluster bacterium]|nr:type II toxin-antitoxin system PemK/MazF family toxin [SAR202 cluster bacterium]